MPGRSRMGLEQLACHDGLPLRLFEVMDSPYGLVWPIVIGGRCMIGWLAGIPRAGHDSIDITWQ